jgi:integrase
MGALDVERLERWLAAFDRAGAARKAWAVLRAILRKAFKWGALDMDVTRREITLPRAPGYEPRLLSIDETREQLRGFYGEGLEAWLLCASSCALRTEEGYGLQWSDVDLRSGTLSVRRGLQWVAGHEVVVEPKTELSRRTLPLPRFAVRRLREIRGGFSVRLIGDLTPPRAARLYRSRCHANGLPYCPPRNLRHSWATNALSAGVGLAVVSKFLGHSDIQTTARYYLRPDIAALRDAQRLYERILIR